MFQRIEAAGVQLHAKAIARTWQSCFQFICGEQLCRKIDLDKPFLVNINPSKQKTADIDQKEFKIEICHDLAERIGLPLLRDQFKVYPFNGHVRVRVRGCKGIIMFHQMCTAQLRFHHPDWAHEFEWPRGKYN